MHFLTRFTPPADPEMIERGFGLSSDHDPNESVTSFSRSYKDGVELKIAFTMGGSSSVFASIDCNGISIVSLTVEGIESVSFQSWHGESILRAGFNPQSSQRDLRIHYEPKPSIHYSAFEHRA
jgi:hypothetical protein